MYPFRKSRKEPVDILRPIVGAQLRKRAPPDATDMVQWNWKDVIDVIEDWLASYADEIRETIPRQALTP